MIRVKFRLTFKPEKNQFLLEAAEKEWPLTIEEVEKMVKRAKSDMADLSYSQVEYSLYVGDNPVWKMTGRAAQEAFVGITFYIAKVWDSFQLYRQRHGS